MTTPPPASPDHATPGELPKAYVPAEHEPRIRQRWEQSGAFHPDPQRVIRGEAKPYAIFIPPPNVTGALHLGHALNNTLQDILARSHRMMGYETLWMPGTDHAGIATQAVVERRLRQEGKLKGPLKSAMTREQFVEQVQTWKDEYEQRITGQLKAMGASCDYDRQRFTMDPICARAVHEAFFRLFKDGLIYRGKRLVNWDPVLQTAVADDECYEEEIDGQFYYLKYPLEKSATLPDGSRVDHITVATTRPETYLGDTAVAMNPKDPRAKTLVGHHVILPLVGRRIPIIADDYVVLPEAMATSEEEKNDPKAKMATGFLKVTPAHDPNDYEIGQRHGLAMVNIFAPDASISDKHGWSDLGEAALFVGLKREEARKRVVEAFTSRGLFEGAKPHRHSVKHSDRSKAIIEPYLSDQWYVKVTDPKLAGAANAALVPEQRTGTGGGLRFHPARYAKTYETWHDNIRDWCISRQLWWGHQIPVWTVGSSKYLAFGPSLDARSHPWAQQLIALGELSGVRSTSFAFQSIEFGKLNVVPGDERALSFMQLLMEFRSAFQAGTAGLPRIRELEQRLSGFMNGPIDTAIQLVHSMIMGVQEFDRDPDVLDTWFSSALWPLSTLGWPDSTQSDQTKGMLQAFNPSNVLSTAREIITLWVSRMVMFNRYLHGEGQGRGPLPFRDVFIHAVVQDGNGKRMAKSAGNGVDPLDIISSHGADAMRFTLCQMTTQTQDVRMPVQKDPKTGTNTSPKFDLGRNFCNKLWNAARYAMSLGKDGTSSLPNSVSSSLSLPDRWMLSRLAAATEAITRAIENYEFSEYASLVYDLLWRDFCDWYLEAIKPTVASDPRQRAVLMHALETIVRLLHPVTPFVTEAIWERLKDVKAEPIAGITLAPARTGGLLCTAGWPSVDASLRSEAAEREFGSIQLLVTAIREIRAQHNVKPSRKITLHLPNPARPSAAGADILIQTLAGVATITDAPAKGPAVAFTFGGQTCHVSDLADAVDAGAERARLEKELADKDKSIQTLEARLANPGYAERAPAAMVQQTRDQLAKAKADRDALAAALARAS